MKRGEHRTILLCLGLCWISSLQAEDFPEIYDVEAPSAKVMSPRQALETMSIPPGFHATVFAAEPDVRQPIALTIDHQGRLWVVECYTYAEGARNFDTTLRDRVLILEDTDGDGVHDKRTVFWDRGHKLTSIALGLGGVYLLGAPQLLFLADRNHDDVPDGEPEVLLDGFNDFGVRHNIVNGLKWGPDGWLYGRQGILETSLVGPPGASPSQRVPINCGVWRYHPTRRQVEVVLQGTTNPWGFDYDQFGEMFIINTVIGHLWHVVPGAHTERMYGADRNPHLYALMGQVADHYHWDTGEPWHAIRKGVTDTTRAKGGGHAHSGLMIYQGGNWPAEDAGKVFAINFHGRQLNRDRLERTAAGYVARHEPDHLGWKDPWFRGIDLLSGLDGGVFVLDWSDTGECHEQDGIHRSSGRIYKILYGPSQKNTPFDLMQMPLADLARYVSDANKWWPREARRVVRDRVLEGEPKDEVVARLERVLHSDQPTTVRLEALWMLHAASSVSPQELESLWSDRDEALRVWGLRLWTEQADLPISPDAVQRLVAFAEREEAGIVLLHLASAMQRLDWKDRFPLAEAIARKELTAKELHLSLMCWYGIEPAIPGSIPNSAQLFKASRSPLLRRFIARRLTERIEEDPDAIDHLLAMDTDSSEVIRGMSEALKGWAHAPVPKHWTAAVDRLTPTARAELAEALTELGVVFGDGRSTSQLIAMAREGEIEVRRRAIRTLATARPADLASVLLPLIHDRDVQVEAIRSLAVVADDSVPRRLLASWKMLPEPAHEAVVDTLVTRASFAKELLRAIEAQQVSPSVLTAFHARQMRTLGDSDVSALLSKWWGEVRSSPEEKSRRMEEVKGKLAPANQVDDAMRSRGRAVFAKQCASCHVLFGEGRKLGPDLTGSQRQSVDYLLENLVDPSAVVAASFRAQTIVMNDGRSIQGLVNAANDRTITVQTKDQDLTVDRKEIEAIQPSTLSLMPDGILDSLSQEQVNDLFAYLMADHQLPLPK